MMIFSAIDYKAFLKEWIGTQENGGRGALNRLAQAAGMQPSNLSQVFNSDKNLNLDQADGIAELLELSPAETDYFYLLIEQARATRPRLKRELERQLRTKATEHQQLARRLPSEDRLSEDQKAKFYSAWYFSAIQIATNLPGAHTVESLSRRFQLPRTLVQEVVQFLLSNGLCAERDGQLVPGVKHTHLAATDSLIGRHHGNWRVKAMERHPLLHLDRELSYSGQHTLSAGDALKVRDLCLKLIEDTHRVVTPSPSERLYAFNLDWIEL
jgi:transcriptional regulator with XRE-family HTH domain